ncbi:hypothetical protein [Listeria booriae]|uniref:hypothetical protein n=1 Tax=Listeria booriae TaxID=1552123 RepID=UPI0016245278|nr:hypothetical protein [Listeria booriae]MBC1801103.1 hypothetical protein [Listeria booriae]
MTQNEKDRFQLESLRLFMELNETQKILFEIADRLLSEKERRGSERRFMTDALSKVENKSITFYENMGDEEIETRYEAIVINEATEYAK